MLVSQAFQFLSQIPREIFDSEETIEQKSHRPITNEEDSEAQADSIENSKSRVAKSLQWYKQLLERYQEGHFSNGHRLS